MVSGFIFSCWASSEAKQQADKDIIGYWKSYRTDLPKDDPGLIKVAINSQGKLVQSIIYESSTQCRIWINNEDISYQDGQLEFWGDEFKGEMSKDRNSIQLKYKSQIPFVWERIHDQKTIAFLDSLEASQGGEYDYDIPVATDDGWSCASLTDVDIDEVKITECIRRIRNGDYQDIHSLLIVKDGKLVLEEYFGAQGKICGPFVNQVFRDRVQMLASVTKSVNSILIGIAQEQGFIKELDAPAFELFPEYAKLIKDGKEQIQLQHLLTMSAGLRWNELIVPSASPQNDAQAMHRSADLIRYCLEKPMAQKPGERFVYHTGLSVILGEILKRAVGISADKFAEQNLFQPLGISAYKWSKSQGDLLDTGSGLALRSRDMAKLGQLFLNNGKWEGKQIVSEKWVKESTQPHIKTPSGAYGYQWWLRSFEINDRPIDSFYAIGNAGQFIVVISQLEMVIVSTAQNYDNDWSGRFYEMMRSYILPAVVSAIQEK
jgi:CubicO group peptidase (beta-lactamase class C family)